MTTPSLVDPVTRDLWQVIAATDEVTPGIVHTTLLLDRRIAFSRDAERNPVVWLRTNEEQGEEIDLVTITARLQVFTFY